jgi:hypothetical protein
MQAGQKYTRRFANPVGDHSALLQLEIRRGSMSELILGALSLLLGYMIIRFILALLRRYESPNDHVIAWSFMGLISVPR